MAQEVFLFWLEKLALQQKHNSLMQHNIRDKLFSMFTWEADSRSGGQ